MFTFQSSPDPKAGCDMSDAEIIARAKVSILTRPEGRMRHGTTGLTDTDSGVDLEFYIWPAALNINLVGGGSFALTLLGYTD